MPDAGCHVVVGQPGGCTWRRAREQGEIIGSIYDLWNGGTEKTVRAAGWTMIIINNGTRTPVRIQPHGETHPELIACPPGGVACRRDLVGSAARRAIGGLGCQLGVAVRRKARGRPRGRHGIVDAAPGGALGVASVPDRDVGWAAAVTLVLVHAMCALVSVDVAGKDEVAAIVIEHVLVEGHEALVLLR